MSAAAADSPPAATATTVARAARARIGSSSTAAAALCGAAGRRAAAVRTLFPLGGGVRPGCGVVHRCCAAAGRLLSGSPGRCSSAALGLRRLATVLAHGTTSPRAGAIA
ncbi:hypothetical protein [Streptomyces melanosporofaciens]|uniref:hypothetical protein n=1 Tax=Streptomyces melanosporofaciens TaxID=67327 RepID=UPI000A77D8C5|nr:hypothetical protein [Streptomyces melanosporofaciens]